MFGRRRALVAGVLAATVLVGSVIVLLVASRVRWTRTGSKQTPAVVGPGDAEPDDGNGDGRAAAMTCTIAVSVVDSESQEPLRGVLVRVYRQDGGTSPVVVADGLTDAAGALSWHGLGGRSFVVVAECPGRVRAVTTADALFDEGEADLGVLRIALAQGMSIECEVRQESEGPPVPGMPIFALQGGWLQGKGGTPADYAVPLASGTTGADGRARLEGMPPDGIVTLVAKADGWTEANLVVQVPSQPLPADAEPLATLSVAQASSFRGRVFRRDGSPASGAMVFAVQSPYWPMLADPAVAYDDPETWDVEDIWALRATADATGAYGIRRLRPGTAYRLLALDGEHLASRVSPVVRAAPGGGEIERSLVLEKLRDIRVVLHGPDGPLAIGTITAELRPLDDSKPPGPAQGGDDGVLVFSDIHPGSYELRVSGGAVLPQSVRLLVEADGPAEIAIRLDPGCSIEGSVVDDQGLPSPSAQVMATPTGVAESDVRVGTAASGPDGSFVIAGLVPGTYLISVQGGGVVSEPVEIRAPMTGIRLLARRAGVLRFRLSGECGLSEEEPSVVLYDAATRDHEGPCTFVRPVRDSKGAWTVADVRPGHHIFVVWIASCAPGEVAVDVSPGQDLSLGEIRLEAGVELQGSVRSPEGKPVAGAVVGPSWNPGASRTEADGRFTVKNLPRRGHVTLVVDAPGFLGDGVDITTTDHREAVIYVSRGGQIDGRVVGWSGSVEDLVVRGRDPDDKVGRRRFETRPDAEGRFKARIHPGTVQVQVFEGDALKAAATAVVKEGGSVDVVLSIE